MTLRRSTIIPNAHQGTPIASGLYSLSGDTDGLESFRPAAYYAGAMAMAGFACVLGIRFARKAEMAVKA